MQTENQNGKTWHPTREDAYRAALLVTGGKCAAHIAKQLYKNSKPASLMRVARLLEFAQQTGLLSLRCPTHEHLERQLTDRFGREFTFHVVNNDHVIEEENGAVDEDYRSDALCKHAALVVAQRIDEFLRDKASHRNRIVIATAGGVAASKVVRFLAAQKMVPEEADTRKLLFISLNAASMPTSYGLSANTLAVRMAEIYRARHIALAPINPAETTREYQEAVRNIDLLVCGAGSKHGILFQWLEKHARIELPRGAVGDICLIPISATGDELHLGGTGPQLARKNLRPNPAYSDLQAVAARNGVILIPVGYQNDDLAREEEAHPGRTHSKLAITRAILQRGLARTTVLGATLAQDLLASP
jgi:DNA-binding transcriptional regulator LsrR (DeoR family)